MFVFRIFFQGRGMERMKTAEINMFIWAMDSKSILIANNKDMETASADKQSQQLIS